MDKERAAAIGKALGDAGRITILRTLAGGDMYGELLAEKLGLTGATVSFHLKKLLAAGLVTARRDGYYMMYALNREVFAMTIGDVALSGAADAQGAQALKEEAYRKKVLKTFMPGGYCDTMPAQQKKRLVVYEEIFKSFAPGVYDEKTVNETILRKHADYCTLRRDFIGLGWMAREGATYTVSEGVGTDDWKRLS